MPEQSRASQQSWIGFDIVARLSFDPMLTMGQAIELGNAIDRIVAQTVAAEKKACADLAEGLWLEQDWDTDGVRPDWACACVADAILARQD